MAYISSNDNRFYVALEQSYGSVAAISNGNRIPAIKLTARQRPETTQRKDKTGSRTFPGLPANLRKDTLFNLRTYMTSWADQTAAPVYGALFEACLGATPLLWAGATAVSISDAARISFAAPHGLVTGQAVSSATEIRFVAATVDDHTVQLNAPFNAPPTSNSPAGPTITYRPSLDLNSVSIFDYWSPGSSVQRILSGAAVNRMKVSVNGDYHEFEFSGPACDVVDSSSFEAGEAALTSFPVEPELTGMEYPIIPGHLGQMWLGSTPNQFFTITKADLTFENALDLRGREFGATLPRAISPGMRSVTLDFSLYQDDQAATRALYQAARQRSPINVMIQLGQQQRQLFGIYLQAVILEVPEFDDTEKRQQWQFQNCRAQGNINDELFLAFA